MDSFKIAFVFGDVHHTATVTKEAAEDHTHYKVVIVKIGTVYVSRHNDEWVICCETGIDLDYSIASVIGEEIERYEKLNRS